MRTPILTAALFIGIFATACGGDTAPSAIRTISASDQGERWSGEAWPLTVGAGTLGCDQIVTAVGRRLDAVWFETTGVRYGINGDGVTRYGPIDPIWADDPGLAPKKNIGVLIDPGLELCG